MASVFSDEEMSVLVDNADTDLVKFAREVERQTIEKIRTDFMFGHYWCEEDYDEPGSMASGIQFGEIHPEIESEYIPVFTLPTDQQPRNLVDLDKKLSDYFNDITMEFEGFHRIGDLHVFVITDPSGVCENGVIRQSAYCTNKKCVLYRKGTLQKSDDSYVGFVGVDWSSWSFEKH